MSSVFPQTLCRLLLAGCLAACTTPVLAIADNQREVSGSEEAFPILYDRQKDTLSLDTTDQPLSDVLLQVMRQTGMDIRLDPAAERRVTLRLKDQPLEKALDRLLAQLNVVKEFGRVGNGKNSRDMLLGLVVMPEGKHDPASAKRLIDRDKELAYRAGVMSQYEKRAKVRSDIRNDIMVERWRLRADRLNAKDKKEYEHKKAALDRQAAEQEAKREAMRAKNDAMAARRLEQQKQLPDASRRKPAQMDAAKLERSRQQFAQPQTPATFGGATDD